MSHFRPLAIVALLLAATLGAAPVFAAGKAKKAPAHKRAAPKVHHQAHRSAVKPKRAMAKRPGHRPALAKKAAPRVKPHVAAKVKIPARKPALAKLTKPKMPKEIVKAPKYEPLRNVRRFVIRDPRTSDIRFDPRWWYSYIVYPTTVSSSELAWVDYETVVPPADYAAAPPVIKAGEPLPFARLGAALANVLDAMDVENHWLSGNKVNWKTGNPFNDEKGPASNGGAFVAAVCARFKVPLSAPAAENFLPGSQHDWLIKEGVAKGWMAVGDAEAQLLANQGWIVIAAWKDVGAAGDRSISGQTAIVRPEGKLPADLQNSGPRIVMAGEKNHNNVGIKEGFPAKAWDNRAVVFLAYRPR